MDTNEYMYWMKNHPKDSNHLEGLIKIELYNCSIRIRELDNIIFTTNKEVIEEFINSKRKNFDLINALYD